MRVKMKLFSKEESVTSQAGEVPNSFGLEFESFPSLVEPDLLVDGRLTIRGLDSERVKLMEVGRYYFVDIEEAQ